MEKTHDFGRLSEKKRDYVEKIYHQISLPPFVKHVLAPQNDFGAPKLLGKFIK